MATINNDNNSNKNLHGDPDGEYEGTHDSVPTARTGVRVGATTRMEARVINTSTAA